MVYYDFEDKFNFGHEQLTAHDWRKILWGRDTISFSYNFKTSKSRQSTLGFSDKEVNFKFGASSLNHKLQKLALICSPYLDLSKHLRVCREMIPTFPNAYAFDWFINSAYEEKDPIKRDVYWHYGISLYKQRCLDIFKKRPQTHVDRDLYYDMSDPFYCDTGKDSYLLEYRRQCEVCHPELNDLVNELMFTHSHFFESMPFWSHPVRDYEYALKKPRVISDDNYTDFRDMLHDTLVKKHLTLEYRDVLKSALKRSSIFSVEDMKNIRRYSKENLVSRFHEVIRNRIDHPWQFKRTLIPVSNGNLRDTFVPSIETFPQMVILEDIARQICNTIPEIKIGKRYIPLGKVEGRIYTMIDIKKFGLTFPRELLQLTMEVIADTFNIDISWMIKNWERSEVLLEDGFHKINRGFGLGNQNFMATLAYWVICKGTGYPFFIYSDDVIFWHRPDQEGLFDIEKYISQFGLEINLKKSYSSEIPEFLGRTPQISYLEYEENLMICRMAEAIFQPDDWRTYECEVQILNAHPELKRIFFHNHHYRNILSRRLLTAPTVCCGYIQMKEPQEWFYRHSFAKDWFIRSEKPRREEKYELDMNCPFEGYYIVYNKPALKSISLKKELSKYEQRRRNLRLLKKIRSAEISDCTDPNSILFLYSKGLIPRNTLEFRKGKKEVRILGVLNFGYNPLLVKRSSHYIKFAFDPNNEFIRTLNAFTVFPVETWGLMSLKYGRKILRSTMIKNDGPFQFTEKIFYQATEGSLTLQCQTYQEILGEEKDCYHLYSHSKLEMEHEDPMLPDLTDYLPTQQTQPRKRKMPKAKNIFLSKDFKITDLAHNEEEPEILLDLHDNIMEAKEEEDFNEEESLIEEELDTVKIDDFDYGDIYDPDQEFPEEDSNEESLSQNPDIVNKYLEELSQKGQELFSKISF